VLTELVLRVTAPAGAQDQQLSVTLRQRVLGEHVSREHQPSAQQCWMVSERAEDVQRRPVRGPQAGFVEQLVDLLAGIGDRRNSRSVHVAILSRRQNAFVIEPPCQFCDVVNGALAAREVLRDDIVVAFLDRSPVFKGHVLIAPLRHTVTLVDLDAELVGPLFERVQRVAARMPAALDCDGTFVAINNVVSQSVAHLHVHVVPRRRKDGLRGFFWPRVRYESDAEADDYALRLRQALAT
jgi:histidine triad (HIT) family protein